VACLTHGKPGRSTLKQTGRPFQIGDRVWLNGGYDPPERRIWLGGRAGYAGTLLDIQGDHAVVELDEEIALTAPDAWGEGFKLGILGDAQFVRVASGRWMVLTHGWVNQEWREPIGRLHVQLSAQRPDLTLNPQSEELGAWIEGHATMSHFVADA